MPQSDWSVGKPKTISEWCCNNIVDCYSNRHTHTHTHNTQYTGTHTHAHNTVLTDHAPGTMVTRFTERERIEKHKRQKQALWMRQNTFTTTVNSLELYHYSWCQLFLVQPCKYTQTVPISQPYLILTNTTWFYSTLHHLTAMATCSLCPHLGKYGAVKYLWYGW